MPALLSMPNATNQDCGWRTKQNSPTVSTCTPRQVLDHCCSNCPYTATSLAQYTAGNSQLTPTSDRMSRKALATGSTGEHHPMHMQLTTAAWRGSTKTAVTPLPTAVQHTYGEPLQNGPITMLTVSGRTPEKESQTSKQLTKPCTRAQLIQHTYSCVNQGPEGHDTRSTTLRMTARGFFTETQ